MGEVVVVPFKFEHIVALGEASGQMLMPPTEAVLLERHPSFSGLTPDGQVVGCAGVVKIWKGRWQAWAHVSKPLAKQYLYEIIKETRKFLSNLGPGRVEAAVLYGNQDHIRFAKTCGFNRVEAEHMAKYLPDGSAATLVARVS